MTTQTLRNKRDQLFSEYLRETEATEKAMKYLTQSALAGGHTTAGTAAAIASEHRNKAQDISRALHSIERQILGNE